MLYYIYILSEKAQECIYKSTWFEDTNKPIPIGIKANPIIKNVGNTVPAVRIGCHAGSFCCLKALSVIQK